MTSWKPPHGDWLPQAGAELNAVDGNSRGALYLAAEMGHLEVVQLLLEVRDQDMENPDGKPW